jgi:protein-S-isoprenylcysteine O-methyltransferase Ste14
MTTPQLFTVTLIVTYLILAMVIWSLAVPRHRIWPPPRRKSWQYHLYWWFFYIDTALSLWLLARDWNTWCLPDPLRFFVGVPLLLLGAAFSLWAIIALGWGNTYGRAQGFTDRGPYQFTRNPQYVGDMVMLAGLMLWANSVDAGVILLLIILTFALMPLPEEQWLPGHYGDTYQAYKASTPRFL